MTAATATPRPALSSLWLPAWLFALYFVYPIPHTIALRNLLILSGLVACAVVLWRAGPASVRRLVEPLRGLRAAGGLLALLTLWLAFQSAMLSPFPRVALGHLRGDWLVELIVVSAGIAAVLAARAGGSSALRPLRALAWALFAHVVLLLAYQGWHWLKGGLFPFGLTPFAQKDYHSMIVTTLLGLLLPDLVAHRLRGRGGLGLPAGASMAMCALSCIAAVTLYARNAVIITVVLLALAAVALLVAGGRQSGRWLVPTVLALLVLGGTITWLGVRSDARWQGLIETAAVAFDTEGNKAWLDPQVYPFPRTASGERVEESAYLRLAWAKVATEQIARYPLGLGYGHKAFGWAINRSYGVNTGHESSHSGVLDFTLANGIPGMALWLALSLALCAAGWRSFRRDMSPAGLMLAFTVATYFIRCVLDGHLSGFRLEMYALLVGVLVAALPGRTETCA